MPTTSTKIRGVDFSDYGANITVAQLTKHFSSTGFQASNLGRAIEIINNMVHSHQISPPSLEYFSHLHLQIRWKPGDLPPDRDDENKEAPPPTAKCTIFLGYTSNLISFGLRETLRYLVQNSHVDLPSSQPPAALKRTSSNVSHPRT
jgi:deoxyhypusine synthase